MKFHVITPPLDPRHTGWISFRKIIVPNSSRTHFTTTILGIRICRKEYDYFHIHRMRTYVVIESVSLPWYIMTSFATDAPTKDFFDNNNFFGLEREQVIFFKQEEFPCITPEGKIILENKCKACTNLLYLFS